MNDSPKPKKPLLIIALLDEIRNIVNTLKGAKPLPVPNVATGTQLRRPVGVFCLTQAE
ncbi:hypothetical protein ACFLVX_00510 [Chloroflexota bacterium]